LRKNLVYIVFTLLLLNYNLPGQNISGVVNSYYKVSGVFSTYVLTADTVDYYKLHPGDKVLLMQMSGTIVPFSVTESDMQVSNFANAGRYEMLAVKSVNNTTKRVDFSVSLNASNYTNSEKLQLIKIYEADYAIVTATLSAGDWDGDKGGVLAMVIYKKLTLNANINVSNKGLLGGLTESNYPDTCRPVHDIYFFPSSTTKITGQKGGGIIEMTYADYTKGPGRVVTGGGGGLGYFAGGGGGGHYGSGGQGGIQKEGCPFSIWWANGGLSLKGKNFYGTNRVTMGGGGGSSTDDAGHTGIKGGDGGGIVIILADTIAGSGSILSQGESISGSVTAGGSGGGAGGAILLDINYFASTKSCSVRGGNGGNTSVNTGAGGGGGGGLVWFAQPTKPTYIVADTARGSRGTGPVTDYYGGWGSYGGTLNKLHLPLNGFLFNSIDGADIICAGQKPREIKGSIPKGGVSGYTYNWLQSPDGINWSAALGTGDSLHFQPNTLTQTTYFTRVVESGAVSDTALKVEVFVYPAITNNILANTDTLCYNSSPGLLTGGNPGGGNGSYSYQWQSSLNQTTWNNRVQTASLNEGNLINTTYYRRIVTSAVVCIDTSNTDIITILPSITNNAFIRTDTAICYNLPGGTVKATLPTGGDNIYRYQWLGSNTNSNYLPIVGAVNQNYPAGSLTSTKYYKRIVHSGEGDACIDTTDAYFRILVYPSITNNIISTDSVRYCAGDIPLAFTGTTPGGGNTPTYTYHWVKRIPGNSWLVISGASGTGYIPTVIYEDTTQVKRVVLSGTYDACIDSSAIIQIDVIPYINNVLVSKDSAICEGSTPLPFSESAATGGAGISAGYGYLWQSKPPTGGSWQSASGTNSNPSYASGALTSSSQFRRVVTSQICSDNSDPVTVTVYPKLGNNLIGAGIQYGCINSEKVIVGRAATGGNQADIRYIWQQSVIGNDLDWDLADGTNTAVSYTSNPLTDTIFFRRIVRSGAYNQCIDTSSSALIRLNSLPAGDIISSLDSVCSGSELTVGYQNLTGHSPWTIVVGEDAELYSEPGITTSSGEFSFTVTESALLRMVDLVDDSLCHADITGNTGLIDLRVIDTPQANAGLNDSVCGLNATLNALPTIGNGLWSGSGVAFDDPSLPNTSVTAGDYGTYTLYWTETNWHCISTNQVTVRFDAPPQVPFAGDDQVLNYTFSTTLDAQPADVGRGYWQFIQGTGTFEDSTLYNTRVDFPFFPVPEIGDHILRWTLYNGVCPAVSDEVSILVGDIKIYGGFSPNDDPGKINDTFRIKLSGLTDCELQIFDRYGNEVYKSPPNSKARITWDGRNMKGVEVPAGTYFYIFRQPAIGDEREGYIELRR
jgi:gliding motility-associated-like protein